MVVQPGQAVTLGQPAVTQTFIAGAAKRVTQGQHNHEQQQHHSGNQPLPLAGFFQAKLLNGKITLQ